MKDTLHRVIAARGDASLEEIDISRDADLLDRYGTEIPVLMIDGKKVAKYRVSEEELRKILERR